MKRPETNIVNKRTIKKDCIEDFIKSVPVFLHLSDETAVFTEFDERSRVDRRDIKETGQTTQYAYCCYSYLSHDMLPPV